MVALYVGKTFDQQGEMHQCPMIWEKVTEQQHLAQGLCLTLSKQKKALEKQIR